MLGPEHVWDEKIASSPESLSSKLLESVCCYRDDSSYLIKKLGFSKADKKFLSVLNSIKYS